MDKLEKASLTIIKECMDVKSSESVLIITDSVKKSIGEVLVKAAKEVTDNVKIIEIPVGKNHGEEPPIDTAEEMLKYDVILIATDKSISHTNARRNASDKGARIASMPEITKDMMERCIDIDYEKLQNFHDKLRKILIDSNEIKVTTKLGTDVVAKLRCVRGKVAGYFHNKGDFSNLPTGEVDSGVEEGSVNGILVVDGSFGNIGMLDVPLTLEVKDGYVVSISGNDAEKLIRLLQPHGKHAYKIAEVGIGTNPKAKITGVVLEDEKVKGTIHFAVGNDLTYEGTNDVKIHLDGVIKKPNIVVDGKTIMEEGKFLI